MALAHFILVMMLAAYPVTILVFDILLDMLMETEVKKANKYRRSWRSTIPRTNYYNYFLFTLSLDGYYYEHHENRIEYWLYRIFWPHTIMILFILYIFTKIKEKKNVD